MSHGLAAWDMNPRLSWLLDQMLIPGVNGGALSVISTATIDPISGNVVPANTASGRDVRFGNRVFKGAALRSERAATGTHGAATFSSNLASNTTAAGAYPTVRTIVENGNNAQHFAQCAAVALTDGVNYAVSTYVSRGSGARDVLLVLQNGANFVNIYLNLTTGAITPAFGGTGVYVRSSARLLSNGFWLVQMTGSATAWGGAVQFNLYMGSAGGGSYTGDGTSSLIISGYQCELGEYATMPLAWDGSAGVSRAATSNSWAQALGTAAGTIPAIVMPYGRNGIIGGIDARVYDSQGLSYINYVATGGGQYAAIRTDGIGPNGVGSAITLAVAGQQQIIIQRWDAASNRVTVNGVTTASAITTPPFNANTPIQIGGNASLIRQFDGWVFAPLFPFAASDADIALIVNNGFIV